MSITPSKSKRSSRPGRPAAKSAALPKSARQRVISRIRKGDQDSVTAYLPVELGTRLRVACAQRGLKLSEAIAEAIAAWLPDE